MTVEEIQRALIARGYDLGKAGAAGDAGPKTIAALAAFQKVAGLHADGIAGPLTQKALGSVDLTQQKATSTCPAGWRWQATSRAPTRASAR
ncbi:peptidoglycan-binding domain-containing protein [Methylobacterium oryzae CBMB20]